MNTKYLIIDGNHMIHRMLKSHNFDDMFTESGMFTGGCYGVLTSIHKVINMFTPERCIYVWDKGLSSRRLDIYPEYKQHKGERTDEDKEYYKMFYDQCEKMKTFLKYLGIRSLEVDKKEGDDICHFITWYFEGNKVVVSGDKDYVLMLAEDVCIYRPIADEYISHKNCKDIIGYTPSEFIFYKVINGDGSDNIKGVDGVGNKTIRGLLDKIDTTVLEENLEDGVYKALEQISNLKLNNREAKVLQRLDIISRNIKLVDFSKEVFTSEELEHMKQVVNTEVSLNKAYFIDLCDAYGFSSILEDPDYWLTHFERLT